MAPQRYAKKDVRTAKPRKVAPWIGMARLPLALFSSGLFMTSATASMTINLWPTQAVSNGSLYHAWESFTAE